MTIEDVALAESSFYAGGRSSAQAAFLLTAKDMQPIPPPVAILLT